MGFLYALRTHLPRWLPLILLAVFLLLVLTGCETDTPQNTFDVEGEVAEKQRNLFYLSMWPALVIGIAVFVAIFVICLRFRERDPNSRPPKQTHGNTRLEVAWTIAPAALLLGLGVPMVAMIYDLGGDPPADAYVVDVIGQRFSWEFQYPELSDDPENPVFTLNEAHIPAGRDVVFNLHSIDVIHSFWVPKLGGKLDVIPNVDNRLVLRADNPGTFSGQCAEYCGLSHALMTMIIHADSPEDFEAWAEEAKAGPGGGGGGGDASATATPRSTGGAATTTPTPTATATGGG